MLRALQVDPYPLSEVPANCLCHCGRKGVPEQRPTPLDEVLDLIIRERTTGHGMTVAGWGRRRGGPRLERAVADRDSPRLRRGPSREPRRGCVAETAWWFARRGRRFIIGDNERRPFCTASLAHYAPWTARLG